jgi:hypothetical protein
MPRKRVDLSSLIKEAQEYNKVTQEDEQVIPVEQGTVKTEKQISVDTDKHLAVNTEIQKSANTELQSSVSTEKQISVNMPVQEAVSTEEQKPVFAATQKTVSTDAAERAHKQTILISEDLAFRLKVHAARRKETIANIATRAFEKLLAEETE